jgi:ABC-2 type transport system ATP-binding protein
MAIKHTIQLNGLSKKYRSAETYALHDVSLTVAPGEVYGFLGANGAGKSTTIRSLLNFIQPTDGTATILGLDSVRDALEVKRHVGYLAGEVALYGKMTGRQFFDYMSELQPIKNKGYVADMIRTFDVELHKPIDTLSKGNRQKIGLLQAFMHEPEVLILDEPTSGLDPLMQEAFFALIREVKSRGASVFVSSHNFAEVQRMCDRVGFIRRGKLVAEQTLADLANSAAHTFDITFTDKAPVSELKKLKKITVTGSSDPRHVTVSLQGQLSPFFGVLAAHNVERIDQQEVNLEEEFLRFYGKENS